MLLSRGCNRLANEMTEKRLVNVTKGNMEEENLNSVSPEIATQETQNHDSADSNVQSSPKAVDSFQERNFRELRERQRELERDLKIQRDLNEKLLAISQTASPKVPEIDELDSISDEDYVPKGKSKKLVRKEVEPLRQEIQELKEQLNRREKQDQFNSLKRQYSDFDEIVNNETMALLEQSEPELADTIAGLKDPYKIGVQTYKYIKALGIHSKVPTANRLKEVDRKLEANAKTIQSPLAQEKRPMAQAFKLTEDEKSKLYEEMTGYARLASSVPEIG